MNMNMNMGNMGNVIPDGRQINESVNNAGNYIRDSMASVRDNVTTTLNKFSSPNDVGTSSSEFLNSNSMIAKFVFFVLVLIVFSVLVSLGIQIMGYLLQTSGSPYLIYGTLNGNNGQIITQDPKQTGSVTLLKSNNQTTGAEFSWSVWINLTASSSPASNVQYLNIFNKGNANYGPVGIATVNNAPGLYLKQYANTSNENTLHVVMDTMDPTNSTQAIDVTEIPFNKWVHVVIRLENTLLDVYVNGVISNRITLSAAPKQNFNDVNICQNGGFAGTLSNLRYYNYALSAFEINSITMYGPNLTPNKLSTTAQPTTSYFLANSWYTSKYV